MPLSHADSNSLVSRLANLILARLREFDKPLREAPEAEQRRVAQIVVQESIELLSDLVHVVAADGFPFEPVKVKKLTDGGATPEMTVQLVGSDIDWQRLHAIAKQEVTLVMLPPSRFDEVREQPEIDKDEPGLPLAEPAPLCPLCEGEGVVTTAEGHEQRCDCQDGPGDDAGGFADADGTLADDRDHLDEVMTADPVAAEPAPPADDMPESLKRPSRDERAEIYQRGVKAYEDGAAYSDCPHGSATWQGKSWQQGWADKQNGMAA